MSPSWKTVFEWKKFSTCISVQDQAFCISQLSITYFVIQFALLVRFYSMAELNVNLTNFRILTPLLCNSHQRGTCQRTVNANEFEPHHSWDHADSE